MSDKVPCPGHTHTCSSPRLDSNPRPTELPADHEFNAPDHEATALHLWNRVINKQSRTTHGLLFALQRSNWPWQQNLKLDLGSEPSLGKGTLVGVVGERGNSAGVILQVVGSSPARGCGACALGQGTLSLIASPHPGGMGTCEGRVAYCVRLITA